MHSSAVARTRRLVVVLGAVSVSLIAGCKGTLAAPGDMNTSQAVVDIGNMVVQLREENAQLQAQIDSLRAVAAYQDTVVRQLAGAAGLQMRPPGMQTP